MQQVGLAMTRRVWRGALVWLLLLAAGVIDHTLARKKKSIRQSRRGPAQTERELFAEAQRLIDYGRGDLLAGLAMLDAAVAHSSSGGTWDVHKERGAVLEALQGHPDHPRATEEAVSAYRRAVGAAGIGASSTTTSAGAAAPPLTASLGLLDRQGRALIQVKHYAEAAAAFRSAVELHPAYLDAHSYLCVSLFEEHQRGSNNASIAKTDRLLLEEALISCDAAIACDPRDHPFGALFDTHAEARELVVTHRYRAIVLSALGRHSEAQVATEAALKLTPEHRPIQDVIDQLLQPSPAAETDLSTGPSWTGELRLLWPLPCPGDELCIGPSPSPFAATLDNASGMESVPVWVAASAGMDNINRILFRIVEDLMKAPGNGVHVSNIGGWQSSGTSNFLVRESARPGDIGAAVRRLHGFILTEVQKFAKSLGCPGEPRVSIRESWVHFLGLHMIPTLCGSLAAHAAYVRLTMLDVRSMFH